MGFSEPIKSCQIISLPCLCIYTALLCLLTLPLWWTLIVRENVRCTLPTTLRILSLILSLVQYLGGELSRV